MSGPIDWTVLESAGIALGILAWLGTVAGVIVADRRRPAARRRARASRTGFPLGIRNP
ncbi:MAG TPA: hypothetical protein VEA15_06635 [Caulobacteraceae bacterium]|nr:hypothetical protein [Caulobacteraceae bacterium]